MKHERTLDQLALEVAKDGRARARTVLRVIEQGLEVLLLSDGLRDARAQVGDRVAKVRDERRMIRLLVLEQLAQRVDLVAEAVDPCPR